MGNFRNFKTFVGHLRNGTVGCCVTSGGSCRTGAFCLTLITVSYTACSVKRGLKFGYCLEWLSHNT